MRRWWSGPALDQATIRAALIRLALTLLAADQPVVVALDTTRLGPGKSGWRASSSLVARSPSAGPSSPILAQGTLPGHDTGAHPAAPAGLPGGVRWTLVADRGFPSECSCQLRQGGTDFSVRLRLSDWVTVDRVYATVSAHLVAGRLVVGQRTVATIGRGTLQQPLVPAAIVVSAAVVTPPRHKQNPGPPASGPTRQAARPAPEA